MTTKPRFSDLLVILLLLVITTLLGGLGLLSPDAARAATTEGRGQGEVDVLLRVETDNERRDVDDLLADADVALLDEDTSVVDRLGETELVDAGLEAALQEILDLEGKDVIELHAGLIEDTDANETANEGIAFEETLGVLLVEGKKLTAEKVSAAGGKAQSFLLSGCEKLSQQPKTLGENLPGSTTNLGQGEEHTPHLTLVAETVLANELQFGVPENPRVSP